MELRFYRSAEDAGLLVGLIYVAFERIFDFAGKKMAERREQKSGAILFPMAFPLAVIYYLSGSFKLLSVHNLSMRLSYREIVSSEDAATEDVLFSLRKDIMLHFFEREQCNKTNVVAL